MSADIGGGIRIPVPNLHTASCDGDIKCPLVKGNTYTYSKFSHCILNYNNAINYRLQTSV